MLTKKVSFRKKEHICPKANMLPTYILNFLTHHFPYRRHKNMIEKLHCIAIR